MAATDTRTITATIARVNGLGFTTHEQPQTWFNLSRYAKPAPTIPPAGTEVRLTLDGDGYVRAIEAMGASTPNREAHQVITSISRGSSIVRMAALKAAVRLAGPGSETDGVLAQAEKLEAWINRAG